MLGAERFEMLPELRVRREGNLGDFRGMRRRIGGAAHSLGVDGIAHLALRLVEDGHFGKVSVLERQPRLFELAFARGESRLRLPIAFADHFNRTLGGRVAIGRGVCELLGESGLGKREGFFVLDPLLVERERMLSSRRFSHLYHRARHVRRSPDLGVAERSA